MDWDPEQYVRYGDERGRPFLDLLARVGATSPRNVVDLGCGPGTMTHLLTRRWPHAHVTGVDSSIEMIDAARPLTDSRLSFEVADVRSWTPPADVDVIVSNALLQWVPEHRELLAGWAAGLPSDGWLAFQVPGNFGAPSHVLMRSLAQSPRWRSKLAGVLRHDDAVDSPQAYATLLLDAGLEVDVWETTYLHLLEGADPVLDWVRGTGLRPALAALDDADREEFTTEYAAALREAYPRTEHGTSFVFRRLFAVARKP